MKRATLFGCLIGALTACEQLTGVADLRIGENAPPSETPDDPDAGTEDAGTQLDAQVVVPDATTDAPPIVDAGIDTGPPPCTALPTNDTFPAAPGAEWTVLGSAAAANPGLRLTPSTGGLAGALWWSNAATFDRFDVSFAYAITTDPASTTYGPGDGLAFAWVSSAAVPALGPTGGGMALVDRTGFAVAVDAYANAEYTDPTTPNISIKNVVDFENIASSGVNMALIDGKAHTVRVRLANGAVTVSVDGNVALGPITLPGYVPYSGFWGFGAATGGAFEEHEIVSVTARIGTTGACAAPP